MSPILLEMILKGLISVAPNGIIKTFAEITSVIEHDNMLYFGSLSEDAVGLIAAP